MAKKRIAKKVSYLKACFERVLVCQKENGRPFLEIFLNEPENVEQQKLGTLGGIFEITDQSEDSSYISNYLISVLKKEYYSKTKRGAVESFEAALRKANLALSKIAEHNSIGWIGNLNAVIFVLEKNNIHFAQTGNAHAFLLRLEKLNDLSDGSSSEEPPHPLKTFTDVLSGRLEKNDRFIIATHNIFDIFSFEEIRKSALKFSFPQLVRFFKTALGNELERSAVLLFEIKEKIKEEPAPQPAKAKLTQNAFSQAAFAKYTQNIKKNEKTASKIPASNKPGKEEKNRKNLPLEKIQEEVKKSNGEFVDKKTGHIYISEAYSPEEQFVASWKEKTAQYIGATFSGIKKRGRGMSQNLKNIQISWKEKLPFSGKNETRKIKVSEKILLREKVHASWEKTISVSRRLISRVKDALEPFLTGFFRWFFQALFRVAKRTSHFFERLISRKNQSAFQEFPKKENFQEETFSQKTLPHLSKIARLFSGFNRKQKIYATLAVLAIIIIPYFLSKFRHSKPKIETPAISKEAPSQKPLQGDKNVSFVQNVSSVMSIQTSDAPVGLINLDGQIFFVGEKNITDLESKKNYPLPDDFFPAKLAVGMDDLNLIFLLNGNNSLYSWSPVTGNFKEEKISIPEGTQISAEGTYLTYLYLFNQKDGQIYRYPRADEGFGEKSNWLKDPLGKETIQGSTDMAINENIFLIQNEQVKKFSRGKEGPFRIENTATPVRTSQIYAHPDTTNLYVLDKTNSRIVKLDSDGNILRQYYNPEIKNAVRFTINSETNKVYFSTQNSVENFEAN